MFHQKRGSNKYVLPLEKWVDWTTTNPEKNVTASKMRRSTQKLKRHIFPLMTNFYNFALKIEPSWGKMDVKSSLKT